MIAMSKLLMGLGLAINSLALRQKQGSQMTSQGVPIHHYWYRHLQNGGEVGVQEAGVYDWVLKLKDGFDAQQLQVLCGSDCSFRGHKGGVPLAILRGSEKVLENVLSRAAHLVSFVEPDTPVVLEEPIQVDDGELVETSADLWGHDAIGLTEAQFTGKGVTVYVMDTGVRVSHSDFGGRAVPTIDTIRGGGDIYECAPDDASCASDSHGHGTHVAGTVGGIQYGVAKEATIAAMKVCCGYGSNIYAGMDWIATNAEKPAVMTMSLGSYSMPYASQIAVDAVVASGVTVTVSAGNADYDACLKSYTFIPSAFGVGAANRTYTRASFSNWGTCVALFAPGVSILSASKSSDGGSTTMSGTSMAAPAVAGASALLLEESPALTPIEVRNKLISNAKENVLHDLKNDDPNLLLWVGA